MIYKRFTEKSAEEWRQIYKVLSYSVLSPALYYEALISSFLTGFFVS